VRIDIMDVAGRRIHTLLDAVVPAGERTIRWDGRGDSGQLARAGLYFVRFRIGTEQLTRRVLIRP
jgi:flagellar hook assembly protein FlgD